MAWARYRDLGYPLGCFLGYPLGCPLGCRAIDLLSCPSALSLPNLGDQNDQTRPSGQRGGRSQWSPNGDHAARRRYLHGVGLYCLGQENRNSSGGLV